VFREKTNLRENNVVNLLIYLQTNFWKDVTGKAADSLEKSTENDNECMPFILFFLPSEIKI
jgi:hypothetical protein